MSPEHSPMLARRLSCRASLYLDLDQIQSASLRLGVVASMSQNVPALQWKVQQVGLVGFFRGPLC